MSFTHCARRAFATFYPQLPITLVQHRPAWFEQLVMRFSNVPHIVVNSPYVATEATGPLPFLRDMKQHPCVLVGRHHPSSSSPMHKNCILDYLQSQGYVSLDASLSPSQQALSNAYSALIESQLEPALLSLRFGDKDAWEQVYRNQYIQASKQNDQSYSLGSRFQAWSVRNVALKQLLDKTFTVQESMSIAREAYTSLETLLQGSNKYLLDTPSPATVDALLWAHLAEALCDVHLVTLLADFPNLIKYFQRIYEEYFRLPQDVEWKVWNQEQNLVSPFQQLPLEESASNEPSTFHDALQMMQSISIHTHDLQEVLDVAKEKRLQESKSRNVPAKQSNLYRWRMGGNILPRKKKESAAAEQPEETPLQTKYRKAHKQNDELWLSAVVAVTAIAVFFGATTRSER